LIPSAQLVEEFGKFEGIAAKLEKVAAELRGANLEMTDYLLSVDAGNITADSESPASPPSVPRRRAHRGREAPPPDSTPKPTSQAVLPETPPSTPAEGSSVEREMVPETPTPITPHTPDSSTSLSLSPMSTSAL
jgi:hypothetical protein